MHQSTRNVLVFSVSSIITLAFVEVTASLLNHYLLPGLNQVLNDDGLMEFDPRYFWRLRVGLHSYGGSSVTVNTRHLRGSLDAWSVKQSGEIRVICLGDSSVFGHGVNDAETFTETCQGLLQKNQPHLTFINAGVPGYSSYQSYRWLQDHGGSLEPDVIVVANLFSDCMTWVWTDQALAAYLTSRWRTWLFQVKQVSRQTQFGRLVAYGYRTFMSDHIKDLELIPWESLVTTGGRREKFRVSLDEYRENLVGIVSEARACNAKVIGLQLSTLEEVTRGKPPHKQLALYKEVLSNVMTEMGNQCLDLTPTFRRTSIEPAEASSLFLDGLHPSPRGHKIIAEELASAITRELSL